MEELRKQQQAESLLQQAAALGASDLHIEPTAEGTRVRVRVDGLLEQLCLLPRSLHSTLITQLKVWSGMDIAEKRVPQDGRLAWSYAGRQLDLRLASLPTIYGEKLALRFLEQQQELLSLAKLSFSETNLQLYRSLLGRPDGLVLLTGPTGSGKTTTLYATLAELDAKSRNIVTLEDPVECKLPGINQVAVNRKAGLDFSAGLRSIVRQDPDVIMLGEIRDAETAAMAIHAALTGHLVFSTLHTNDSVGVIYRLLDMGVEVYLLAAALRGAVAQRLVRRCCPHCRRQRPATAAELAYLGLQPLDELQLWEGVGCEQCRGTGYKGRVALQELLVCSPSLQRLIAAGASESSLREQLRLQGAVRLYEDARAKVLVGLTTVAELWRVGVQQEVENA